MSDDLHVSEAYEDGSHSIMACPRCPWVGHVDRSNAIRDANGRPLLDRCPRDGTPFHAPGVEGIGPYPDEVR